MKTTSLELLENAGLPSPHARAILKMMENELAIGSLATKTDLDRFATKADLERFATKADLERFATKADLERFAIKADLERYPTKEDLKRELERFVTKEELKVALAEFKAEIVRWMFLFWVGQLAAVIAVVKLLK